MFPCDGDKRCTYPIVSQKCNTIVCYYIEYRITYCHIMYSHRVSTMTGRTPLKSPIATTRRPSTHIETVATSPKCNAA